MVKTDVSLSVHYLTLATLFDHVLPVYTCEMFYFVWSLLIIIIVNHYWLKFSQKTIPLLFIVKAFFLKQNSVLLLLLLIFVSLAVFTVALFTGVFIELASDALALWKKKRIRTSCNLFIYFFCFVCFKCYCFCLHWIKTKPYSANKAKLLFTDFFLSFLEFLGLF